MSSDIAHTERSAIDINILSISSLNVLDRVLFSGVLQNRLEKALSLLALLLEYLIGALIWLKIFNFGNFALYSCDWLGQKVYFDILTTSIRTSVIPLHVNGLLHDTNRFLASPEINLLPHVLLLRWLTPAQFVAFNAVVMFSVGFLGCWLLKRRYKLSHAAFIPLLLAFSFNGHLISHSVVGHPWAGLLFLPFFFLGLLGMVDGSKRDALTVCGAMGLLAMSGAIHCFIWCAMILSSLYLYDSPRRFMYVTTLIGSFCLACGRFAPAAVSLKAGLFQGGFETVADLVQCLIIRQPAGTFNWEINTYIGLAGLAFLILFGFSPRDHKFKVLSPVIVLFTVMSVNYWYWPVYASHIPLFSAERVTSRFLIVAVLLLFIFACINFQRWLEGKSFRLRAIVLVLIGLFATDLLVHISSWTIVDISACKPDRLDYSVVNQIVTIDDPSYVYSLIAGWTVSILSWIALVFAFLRVKDQHSTSASQSASAPF